MTTQLANAWNVRPVDQLDMGQAMTPRRSLLNGIQDIAHGLVTDGVDMQIETCGRPLPGFEVATAPEHPGIGHRGDAVAGQLLLSVQHGLVIHRLQRLGGRQGLVHHQVAGVIEDDAGRPALAVAQDHPLRDHLLRPRNRAAPGGP